MKRKTNKDHERHYGACKSVSVCVKDYNSNNSKRQDDSNSVCKVGGRERERETAQAFFLDFCTPADDLRSIVEAPLVVVFAAVALTDVEDVVGCCWCCSVDD